MLNQRLMPGFFMATMDMDSTVTMDTMVLPTTDMPTMVTMDILMPTTDITMVRGLLMLSQLLMLTMPTMDMDIMDTMDMDMPTMDTMDTHMPTMDTTDIIINLFSIC